MQAYILLGIVFLVMILIERRFPGQDYEKTPNWWKRAIFFNAMQLGITLATGYIWTRQCSGFTIFNGQAVLGTCGCVVVGYLIITFIFYWWHRMRHQIDVLWIYLHQIHHSPRRIEVVTSFYKHPLEIFLDSLLTSFILYTLLGSAPGTATITIAIAGIAEMIYHWNIKTPYWLGYFFQRPEMHLIHHKQGFHHNNYSDLPLWDMIFGTYENPKEFTAKCGYKDSREVRIWDMLRFVDVNPRQNKVVKEQSNNDADSAL